MIGEPKKYEPGVKGEGGTLGKRGVDWTSADVIGCLFKSLIKTQIHLLPDSGSEKRAATGLMHQILNTLRCGQSRQGMWAIYAQCMPYHAMISIYTPLKGSGWHP